MQIEEKIKSIIDNLKPYLVSDGGNIACANCNLIDVTLYDGIESVLKDEIPEIKGIINVD